MHKICLNSYYIKLFLYVVTASLTALLADLQHYICHFGGDLKITWSQLLMVFINFALQGLIAWRAFIDDSSEKKIKNVDVPSLLTENTNTTNPNIK